MVKLTLDIWGPKMTEFPIKRDVNIVVGCPESGAFLVSTLGRNVLLMGMELKPGEQLSLEKTPKVVSIVRLTPEEARDLIVVLERAVKGVLDG